MTGTLQRIAAGIVSLAATVGIVALSRAPYRTGTGDAGALRLSWSGRPERIERCRELSEEELAKRPAHMRLRLECEGHPARYAVQVRSDGVVLSLDTVTGGGLRGDRAIHMLREYAVPAGMRAVSVEITRIDSVAHDDEDSASTDDEEADSFIPGAAPASRARRERDERRRQRQEMLPAALSLDTTMQIPEGRVVMVTYDPTRRRLVAITGGSQASR
jgi:hypothetical protein